MRKIAIIHFSPIELYPPIQNLLQSLDHQSGIVIYVYTTRKVVSELSTFTSPNSNLRIKRFGFSGTNLPPLSRWFGYCLFHIGCFLHMVVNKPVKVLYYETLSFLPVYLYRTFINWKVGIWAHYHEYTSPAEYNGGMKLSRKFHKLERQMYQDMYALSHTNEHRLKMFLTDIAGSVPKLTLAIPNFPPRTWVSVNNRPEDGSIRVIYIGALSLDTMYAREFATWVLAQQGKVLWDIYTFNASGTARYYFENLSSEFIAIRPGVDYDKLPELLSRYDVGVILYTGHISNYIHNAPNKLFEYLRMGLQVWLPDSLLGAKPYLDCVNHPKVLAFNFKELILKAEDIVVEKIIPENKYIAEEANKPLIQYLESQ